MAVIYWKCVCKAIKATFSIFSASLNSFLRQRICQFAWKKLSIFVRKKDYPKLRGRAADLKGLGPAMLALWLRHTRDSAEARFAHFLPSTTKVCTKLKQLNMSFLGVYKYHRNDSTFKSFRIWHQELHKKIATILKLSVATDKLLEDWGPANGYLAVPAQPHKDLLEKGFAMCTLYCQVSQKMKDLDIRVFNVTSKLHQTEHVFLLAKSIHPYLCWNFRGEEYMGTMSISGCLEYKHVAIL